MTGKSRRFVFVFATALLLVLASGSNPLHAQSKEVRLLSWGGTIQTMLEKEGWADRFAEDTGYKVTLVPKATSAEIIATAIAQKDRPQIDVVLCDLVAYLQGVDQGIFARLEEGKVPNLAKMLDIAKVKDQGIMTYADILSIIYHEEVFKKKGWAPPKSWADLMRPELKGQLIIPPVSNTYGLYALVELARLHGGSEKNIDPGFEAMKKIAPGVVDWTTTFAKIGTLMQSETGSVAVFGNASGWEIKERGTPVNVIIPEPAYMSPTVAGIMKGSPNPDGAAIFLNWFISEKVLAYRAGRFGQTPMNRDVKVSGPNANRVLTGDALNKLVRLDYEAVVAKRTEWNQRFEREVASIK